MKNTAKKTTAPLFQILLLDNNANSDVTVHETEKVNYSTVKQHLNNGGSVFITSKHSQKIATPKKRAHQKYNYARRKIGNLLLANLRSSKPV
ncbi:MAG: hypothetical protein NWF01_09635 [Candidatus Bathyarchaeota archaeon]|nr:hypothetical protein [Candidatus Bathyarchaeota archaeon]